MRFAIRAAESFGDVEDDVGPGGAEPLGKVVVGLEADHFAVRGERGGDGVDRFGGVPLGERRRSMTGRRLFVGDARARRYWRLRSDA